MKQFAITTLKGAVVVYANSKKKATEKLNEKGYKVKEKDVYNYATKR